MKDVFTCIVFRIDNATKYLMRTSSDLLRIIEAFELVENDSYEKEVVKCSNRKELETSQLLWIEKRKYIVRVHQYLFIQSTRIKKLKIKGRSFIIN